MALSYPICHFFMAKKYVDKSGSGEKSGCHKLEDALYLILQAVPRTQYYAWSKQLGLSLVF